MSTSASAVSVDPPARAAAAEVKVNQPHPWAGRLVCYWRVTNQTTGEISPLPAMLIEPSRLGEGAWEVNFFRRGQMQGRSGVRFSEKPRAGFWTWPPAATKAGK